MIESNAEFSAGMRPGRYAAIDIGTVTCRMLVADVDAAGCLHELDREYAITNLGEGVDASNVLKPAAIERVANTVGRYQAVLQNFVTSEYPVIEPIVLATSAARDAKNAADLEVALANVGVSFAVIPGEREAALSFSGASCEFEKERIAVVDIGGGSTEVIVGQAGTAPDRSHSFNIGCRRVTERFFVADPPTTSELEAARAWIRESMQGYFEELQAANLRAERLVAVAGTATTVVSIREGMQTYDSSRVHKAIVTREQLDVVYDTLRSVALPERERIIGLDPGRAPVIVAGMIILQEVLNLGGFTSFTVSETDILHGIILDKALI